MHEGKGKAYDKREKGKAGAVKGKRERPQTENLIRDPTRQADRAQARHETISRSGGACLKANSLPPTSDPKRVEKGSQIGKTPGIINLL